MTNSVLVILISEWSLLNKKIDTNFSCVRFVEVGIDQASYATEEWPNIDHEFFSDTENESRLGL